MNQMFSENNKQTNKSKERQRVTIPVPNSRKKLPQENKKETLIEDPVIKQLSLYQKPLVTAATTFQLHHVKFARKTHQQLQDNDKFIIPRQIPLSPQNLFEEIFEGDMDKILYPPSVLQIEYS